jgi:DNA processing protein
MDIRSLLLLSRVPGVGPRRLTQLVSRFGDPELILRSEARTLLTAPGINRKTAVAIARFLSAPEGRDARLFVDHQLARLKKVDGRILTLWDRDYPPILRTIFDPPPYLFLRGALRPPDAFSIAIVGTRRPSSYGVKLARLFAKELAQRGITVVSGLARGIDTQAHRGAVESGGRTIAVVGTGVDVVYPAENLRLAEYIPREGAILSEFEMGARPDPSHFPRRNRIISGMTLGTLVVETGVDGGAMITAGMALDQNREVFAVPSPVTGSGLRGTNFLIKNGRALLTENVDDLLQELSPRLNGIPENPLHPGPDMEIGLTSFERHVLDAIEDHPTHINTLAHRCNSSVSDLLPRLLTLELKGFVRQSPGKLFTRV